MLGPGESQDAAGQHGLPDIGHRFDVRIFWGKDYDSSQDDFEAMAYNSRDHATKPGILGFNQGIKGAHGVGSNLQNRSSSPRCIPRSDPRFMDIWI